MVSAVIGNWLAQAGLQQFTANFAGLPEDGFLKLIMQDFPRYGITSLEDKQKLYRLIKAVKAESEPKARPAPAPAQSQGMLPLHDANAGLLNLDDHDEDLLAHQAAAPQFQLSPLHQERQAAAAAPAPAGGEEDADPPKIRVVVRKRPINRKELEKGEEDIVEVSRGAACVLVNEMKLKVDLTKYCERHRFNFDEAMDETISNDQVYMMTVQPLVGTLFTKGKATCFAYGQTGSGKTYTMSPLPIRAAADMFRLLAKRQHAAMTLFVSCFEIYGNKVFDLLNARKKLNILEDGKKMVQVVGLKEAAVHEVEQVKAMIRESEMNRSVGSTAANADSSRSHSIMQFALKAPGPDGEWKLVGKLSFIDLAGSERGADTFDNNRQTRMEGAEINKSLLALKECIRALDSDARHVPFRGSKLTAVLRDSFIGGNARTVMIANISPCAASVEHTLNTLRYADRVKELRKDKAQRAPGGVTPGAHPEYYAAAARAAAAALPSGPLSSRDSDADFSYRASDVPARPPRGGMAGMGGAGGGGSVLDHLPQHRSSPSKSAANGQHGSGAVSHRAGVAASHQLADAVGGYGEEEDEEDLLVARDELMSSILEEEEELITAHRQQIEDNMDVVRKEMALLTEVDTPGSAIDQYVDKLEGILAHKAAAIAALQAQLASFKGKLKQEEILSMTVGKARWSQM